MTKKTKVLIISVALLTSFALGRYTVPTKTTETKDTSTTEDKTTDKTKHKKVTIVETTKPDGTKTKTTVITEDTDTHKTDDSATHEIDTKETVRGDSKVTISLLGAIQVNDLTQGIVYGLSATKPVLGPITIGVFGLTNKTVGASIGLSF